MAGVETRHEDALSAPRDEWDLGGPGHASGTRLQQGVMRCHEDRDASQRAGARWARRRTDIHCPKPGRPFSACVFMPPTLRSRHLGRQTVFRTARRRAIVSRRLGGTAAGSRYDAHALAPPRSRGGAVVEGRGGRAGRRAVCRRLPRFARRRERWGFADGWTGGSGAGAAGGQRGPGAPFATPPRSVVGSGGRGPWREGWAACRVPPPVSVRPSPRTVGVRGWTGRWVRCRGSGR